MIKQRILRSGLVLLLLAVTVVTVLDTQEVRAAADVKIEASAQTNLNYKVIRGGIFWTSKLIGYVIYIDSSYDLKYNKTSDGGATWAGTTNIRTGTIHNADCWADWQTPGDTGTKIHIVYADMDTDDIRYCYLDVSTDAVGGDTQIESDQSGIGLDNPAASLGSYIVSITKTRGGNLATAFNYQANLTQYFGFYTSPDGVTWTSKSSLWEASGDFIQLYPGNEADNQDIWATFWDTSTDEISLKTFDNSGNSWSEQLISASMAENIAFIQFNGQVRISDGHLIFSAWSAYNDAGADLMVWDINGAGSITAKSDVITNEANSGAVSVFINHVNDDIYVTYFSGSGLGATVQCFYKKSTDGGANWGGETAMQADAEDDERWISAGVVKPTGDGHFMPVWFNDDLDDIFCNTSNGVAIEPSVVIPTLTTSAATSVTYNSATGNGNITDTGGENPATRGFCYSSATNPPTILDSLSNEAGSFGVGAYSLSITGLSENTLYYVRPYATNSAGTGYGTVVTLTTITNPADLGEDILKAVLRIALAGVIIAGVIIVNGKGGNPTTMVLSAMVGLLAFAIVDQLIELIL